MVSSKGLLRCKEKIGQLELNTHNCCYYNLRPHALWISLQCWKQPYECTVIAPITLKANKTKDTPLHLILQCDKH